MRDSKNGCEQRSEFAMVRVVILEGIGLLVLGAVIVAGLIVLTRKVRQIQWIGEPKSTQAPTLPEQSSNTDRSSQA